jgi:hypothetical protein
VDGAGGHATREVFVENARHGLRVVRGELEAETTAGTERRRVVPLGFRRDGRPRPTARQPLAVVWPTLPRDPMPAA